MRGEKENRRRRRKAPRGPPSPHPPPPGRDTGPPRRGHRAGTPRDTAAAGPAGPARGARGRARRPALWPDTRPQRGTRPLSWRAPCLWGARARAAARHQRHSGPAGLDGAGPPRVSVPPRLFCRSRRRPARGTASADFLHHPFPLVSTCSLCPSSWVAREAACSPRRLPAEQLRTSGMHSSSKKIRQVTAVPIISHTSEKPLTVSLCAT